MPSYFAIKWTHFGQHCWDVATLPSPEYLLRHGFGLYSHFLDTVVLTQSFAFRYEKVSGSDVMWYSFDRLPCHHIVNHTADLGGSNKYSKIFNVFNYFQ